jgi:hypothetical protein
VSFDLAESQRLHARARAFIDAFERGEDSPEPFDRLGCDLVRYQARCIPGYARLCEARGVDVASLLRLADAPAVPTDAFKLTRIAAHPPELDRAIFTTSGTTRDQRGLHAFRDTETYERASIAFARAVLFAGPDGLRMPVSVTVIGPAPSELPESSLTRMFEWYRTHFGDGASEADTFVLQNGVFDLITLDDRISRLLARGVEHALVVGTSFAFVHLLDALGDDTFRLPPKTVLLQTGGFKGRSREVDADRLRRDLSRAFYIDPAKLVTEYGMTELSSQFYTRPGVGAERREIYVAPPWAQVVPVDPETLAPVPRGEIGIARICDLMNVDSAAVVLTQDRVRESEDGFELLGRSTGAPPRGCSLTLDDMMR